MSALGEAEVEVVSWCVNHDRPYGWSQCSAGNDACDIRHFDVRNKHCEGCSHFTRSETGDYGWCESNLEGLTVPLTFSCLAWEEAQANASAPVHTPSRDTPLGVKTRGLRLPTRNGPIGNTNTTHYGEAP